MVEAWFSILTRKSVRHGSFDTVNALVRHIRNYIQLEPETNPFIWTKDPAAIIKKVVRGAREHVFRSKTGECLMFYIVVGTLLVLGALIGPAVGLKLYQTGRPGGGTKGKGDTSLGGRLANAPVGFVLIAIAVAELRK